MSAARLPSHEGTTAQLGAAYPFVASRRLGVPGVLVGRDLAGGPFLHDPFSLYAGGMITNPNLTVLGQIGRGKSALVKSYLYRQAAFGRQVAVLDPKGEYAPLAAALGTAPITLSPAGRIRVNPLDEAGLGGGEGGMTRQRRLVLLGSLAEATLRRRLAPGEHLALEIALDRAAARASPPTLGDVVEEALRPAPEAAREAGIEPSALAGEGREVGLSLRRLVRGDLAGMFDGETSPWLRPGGLPRRAAGAGRERAAGGAEPDEAGLPDALVLDLSDVYHSEALPALMVCAAAWLEAMTSRARAQSFLVVDEAWAVLSDVAVGRYLRSSWKLARARGVANVAVCHRASDLSASGAAGSEEARLAEGLLADSETVVCYAQPASELPLLASLLGCATGELAVLPSLPRGVALWRVAGHSYLVEHVLAGHEREMADTDGRFRPIAGR